GCTGTLTPRGGKVPVVDAHCRRTAPRCSCAAPDATPFPAAVVGLSAAGNKVHREVAKFTEDFALIVIDCPPAIESPVPQSALLIADLALVPIIPSPPDLWWALGMRPLFAMI